MFYSGYGKKDCSHDDMLNNCVSNALDLVPNCNKLYPLQKQIILKLLSTIELVLDNNWEGVIKVNKDLLKMDDN